MIQNWYNLESLLAQYGESISEINEERLIWDRNCFNKLKTCLKQFINSAKRVRRPESSNPAVMFLHAISEFRKPIIYSFNYTDLKQFASLVGINDLSCIHVHGALEGPRDIVFGVKDDTKLPKGYNFLRKNAEPTYSSTDLVARLMEAKEVVFFGHSFAENDYHFFSRFFQVHSDEYISDSKNRCKITIITANQKSREDILENLRVMNNGKIDQLFSLNDFRFVRTIEQDNMAIFELHNWIKELQVTK